MKRLGFAMCASFCTFERALEQMEALARDYEVHPIMSEFAAATDTRFGQAEEFRRRVEAICGRAPICTIRDAEPMGPRRLLDVLLIAPCTGNTLGKLAGGITDTSVTMACKAHLRNGRPVVIAVSTNDGLGASARNIAQLENAKNLYFVPYGQDDYVEKPGSLVADFTQIPITVEYALQGKQYHPMLTQV